MLCCCFFRLHGLLEIAYVNQLRLTLAMVSSALKNKVLGKSLFLMSANGNKTSSRHLFSKASDQLIVEGSNVIL